MIDFPDMIETIQTRRSESWSWLKKVAPHHESHYLNVPDLNNLQDEYLNDIFYQHNKTNKHTFLTNKITDIVKNDVVLLPTYDSHPSHQLAYQLGYSLKNKKVFYRIDIGLTQHVIHSGHKYCYDFVLNNAEANKKRTEFQEYYQSQYENFTKTKAHVSEYEIYFSDVELEKFNV